MKDRNRKLRLQPETLVVLGMVFLMVLLMLGVFVMGWFLRRQEAAGHERRVEHVWSWRC